MTDEPEKAPLTCPQCGHAHRCEVCGTALRAMVFVTDKAMGWMCPQCIQRIATPVDVEEGPPPRVQA